MSDETHELAYAIGFDLPFRTILEMLLRSSVSFGGVVNLDHRAGQRQVMQALTDGNGRNKALVESALSVFAEHQVIIIVYENRNVFPSIQKAFLAFCHILLPDVCPFRSIPRRFLDAGSFSRFSRQLRIEAVVKEHILCRWDERQLDLRLRIDEVGPLPIPRTHGRHSTPTVLPPEVVDAILCNLRVPALEEDRPLWWIPFSLDVMRSIVDLNAAGLVNRSWLSVARRLVLNTVPLYLSRSRVQAFHLLLQNPEWRGYIKRLYWNFPLQSEGLNDKDAATLITGCVQYLGHLEGLHFDNVNKSFVSSSILTMVRLPTGLKCLGFRVIGYGQPVLNQDGHNAQPYTPPCAFPLPSLGQLRTLCLSGVSLFNWTRNPSLSKIRRVYLHWMQLQGTTFHGFLEQLLLTPIEVLAMSRVIVSPTAIVTFAKQSQTLRAFAGGDLGNPVGIHPWQNDQYQGLEGALGIAVDKRWIFPHAEPPLGVHS